MTAASWDPKCRDHSCSDSGQQEKEEKKHFKKLFIPQIIDEKSTTETVHNQTTIEDHTENEEEIHFKLEKDLGKTNSNNDHKADDSKCHG